MRRVSILGATGSIGQSTIDLIARAPDEYDVVALTGGQNIARLAADARALGADLAVTADEALLPDLRAALAGSGVEAAAGRAALTEAAARPADWVMSAIVGAAGLAPGLVALEQGATLALANKESLVTAGPLVLETALAGADAASASRVIITASGGAFRDWPLERLAGATVAEASSHPNWDMGQRITIDSASMFNKALEMIEAREFFGFAPAKIEVLIHPQSLVHALVGFADGGLIAHVGPPDMRHAIGYALHWPERRALPVAALDLAAAGTLEFRTPCETRYPALRLARAVMEEGGLAGAIFNAAKERALDHFIKGRLGFMAMAPLVETVLERLLALPEARGGTLTLDRVAHMDHLARQCADQVAKKIEQG
jgi:1-deoxy-D-xylulose-5-phosphate reductoisomerase